MTEKLFNETATQSERLKKKRQHVGRQGGVVGEKR